MTALQLVADEGSDERTSSIEERIDELRQAIETRMRLIERLSSQHQAVAVALTTIQRSPPGGHEPVVALLTSFSGYLKRRMSEVRPNAELRRKVELAADLAAVTANRDMAILLKRSLDPELYSV